VLALGGQDIDDTMRLMRKRSRRTRRVLAKAKAAEEKAALALATANNNAKNIALEQFYDL